MDIPKIPLIRKNPTIQYYVVCVIDLLDQAARMEGWSKLPRNGLATSEFISSLKCTVGSVKQFKKMFRKYFNQMDKINLTKEQFLSLSNSQQEEFKRFKTCSLKIQQFSDTFVFFVPIRTSHNDISPVPIYRIITTCCMAMLISLAAKIPLRGGVSIGTGLEITKNNFYGPGLAKAHYLESKLAKYPRIIVSKEISEFMKATKGFSEVPVIDQCFASLANITKNMLSPDKESDNFLNIDFLGPSIITMLGDQINGIRDTVSLAYSFVRDEHLRFVREQNKILIPRYDALQKYIETRLPLWGIEFKHD